MKTVKQLINACLLCTLGLIVTPAYSVQTDIFLVYLGADKKTQKSVKKILPTNLKVKSYNASLLAMADYSGKQKAVSKLSSAKLVVLITTKPISLLGEPNFEKTVTIESAEQVDIDKIMTALPK